MGWFDRLLGREKVKALDGEELTIFSKRGWESTSEDKRAATTHLYLETVAEALGIREPVVVPHPQRYCADLRGSASGFPLKITVDYSGGVGDIVFRYADTQLGAIDLEYDPEMPDAPASAKVEPWDEEDKQVFVAPQIFLEGTDADLEAARFRELPRELQTRVIDEIRRLRIQYFRSRREEFEIAMHDDAKEVGEPVQWLVDVTSLALEVAGARGAVPPGSTRTRPGLVKANPGKIGTELAIKLSRAVPGAKLVKRPNDEKLDVRWTDADAGDVAVRAVVDLELEDLEIEVRAEGAPGSFDLFLDPEVSLEPPPATDDPWDETSGHIFFAKSIYVHGTEASARREAAILDALEPHLLDELVRTMEELHVDYVGLDDQLLTAALGDLVELPPDADARALRVARLLARVAQRLPRAEITGVLAAVRCRTCHGLWLPSATRTACTHCGVASR